MNTHRHTPCVEEASRGHDAPLARWSVFFCSDKEGDERRLIAEIAERSLRTHPELLPAPGRPLFPLVNSPRLIGRGLDRPYQMCGGLILRNVFPQTGSHCGPREPGWRCVCQPSRLVVSPPALKKRKKKPNGT